MPDVLEAPRNNKPMFNVIPNTEALIIFGRCCLLIFTPLFKIKGIIKTDARINLRRAMEKGGVVSKVILRIGVAIPQITADIIKAKMPL